ncbi:hypothetical protein [Pseudoduganella aquatica]|uniref:Uncharacterized protein n=1 Tax=Pseudoduganella aquatica TaxID=2660641 RepID=A0A7X4H7P3_9BURK|nr:hypothetical protein [Pseudoduganella aquatica]MYN06224.1 hypothetical protein [Pseudoduganella aquatica]
MKSKLRLLRGFTIDQSRSKCGTYAPLMGDAQTLRFAISLRLIILCQNWFFTNMPGKT